MVGDHKALNEFKTKTKVCFKWISPGSRDKNSSSSARGMGMWDKKGEIEQWTAQWLRAPAAV